MSCLTPSKPTIPWVQHKVIRPRRAGAHLPAAEQAHEEEAAVALEEELGDEVEVGDEGGLQDDGHVGGVKELDRVGGLRPPPLLAAHREVHPETLHGRGPRFHPLNFCLLFCFLTECDGVGTLQSISFALDIMIVSETLFVGSISCA